MRLPNAERAVVAREKITEYLLSFTHPEGESKARFFTRFGFTPESWEELATALLSLAVDNEPLEIGQTHSKLRRPR